MGCFPSTEAPGSGPPVDEEKEEKEEEEGEAVQVSLSAESRQVIKQSWKEIQDDISRVGVIMFIRLFETHPECKDVFFMFRDVDDLETLRTSRELRAHGLRIMSFIEKTVARIDQDERLDQLILDLGRKHHRYNALPKYYKFVGAEFIRAVQPVLKERWSSDLEEAWKILFLYISRTMKRGFQQEDRDQRDT
ncbi:neuroglobin-like [Dicentrarchus labrax]|uniref:neuroglobin-like n=1 Tax=Dicentrarchus labrax TaxID=13489 RepID=UPI0021F63E7D|nr:neuroglobin-like [Dicentrarchus labrax]